MDDEFIHDDREQTSEQRRNDPYPTFEKEEGVLQRIHTGINVVHLLLDSLGPLTVQLDMGLKLSNVLM